MLLYKEGPTTPGIFRRSANAKICKEIKEKLNSGTPVSMAGESVFVSASVLTVSRFHVVHSNIQKNTSKKPRHPLLPDTWP